MHKMPSGIGKCAKIADALANAAVDPSRWNEAMEVTAQASGAFGALLLPLRGRQPEFPMTDSLRRAAETYVGDGWIHRDVRYGCVPAIVRRGVATEFDFTTADEIARHPYYQEFQAPFGLRWFAGVKVGSGDDIWALSIQRSISQGPFSPAEIKELAVLSCSLAGIIELARAFGSARIDGALQAFEMSGSAVMMLDRCGEVMRANSGAEGLLGSDLQIVRRRLVSFDRNATGSLDRALHALIWSKESLALHPPVVLPRKRGRPILAYLSRCPNSIRQGIGLCQAIVVLVDVEARPAAPQRDLIEAFRLTPAEARLAARIAAGESIETVAEQLGIAYATARNVLKSVFRKTETRRQGELVALLMRLSRRPKDNDSGKGEGHRAART
jgi:DNA-binding CsgD family transcriptional regulator